MGLVYRSPRLYRLAMTILEGREGARRRRTIVEMIPPGSSVVDLCCGDARLARPLARRGCTYVGLDINRRFVSAAAKRGIDVRYWDAATMDIPAADVVCMLSSLYHFIPGEQQMFDRMLAAARRLVVISEPISNWATSESPTLRRVSKWLTNVNGEPFTERHSEDSLRALVQRLPAERVTVAREGRELVLTALSG